MTTIYGLAVSAQATFDMHSLNNEGGEGNQIQTRMADIMGADDRLYQVNAISGDMLKHIQAEHLFRLAQTSGQPLCAACAHFDANRISGDEGFIKRVQANKYSNVQTVDELLQTCVIDDLEGILITAGNRSVPRKSVFECGWVVGVPNAVRTEQYFHVKYNPQARNREEAQAGGAGEGTAEERSSNLGQAIFHRPASSGHYAIVTHLEVARIGYNDIAQRYAIDEATRTARLRLLLLSLLYTFVQPNGAMRNTQLPHLVGLKGVITLSHTVLPAPTVSPLHPDYETQLAQVVEALNRLPAELLPPGPNGGGLLSLRRFGSVAEFADQMVALVAEATPYQFATR